jgi:uroporphyrinogen-III synthase
MTSVLIIRKDDTFSATLREAGFNVEDLELMETSPIYDLSALREKLEKLSEYDGLFFTSPAAAEIFVTERNGSNGFFGNVYALGRRAQSVLESAGLTVKMIGHANTAEEMLSRFGNDEFAGKRFLFIRGEKSMRTIPDRLCNIAVIDEVAVYKTEPTVIDQKIIDDVRLRLANNEFDLVCFFSPSAVERFAELFSDAAAGVRAAAIGSTTADAATNAGLNVEFVSPRSTAEDFARGLVEDVRQAVHSSRQANRLTACSTNNE